MSDKQRHDIDVCYFNGEWWQVICSCGWEGWNMRDERRAREFHAAHVLDPLPDVPRLAVRVEDER